MTINAIWNKRGGPGGRARHLHPSLWSDAMGWSGGELGSTYAVKVWFSFVLVPTLPGYMINANNSNAFESVKLMAANNSGLSSNQLSMAA